MDMPGGAALTAPNVSTRAHKHTTGFLDLPAELRNQIYHLSGCLEPYQCRTCNTITYSDSPELIEDYEAKRIMQFGDPYRQPAPYWKYRCTRGPYIWRYCCLKTQENRVHDLNHTYHKFNDYRDLSCGFPHRNVLLWINRRSNIAVHHNIKRSTAQEVAGKFPAIAQTCTRLRAEVLSILIATHHIYATVFDAERDGSDILQTLATIGPGTAANIKHLEIIYSKKKDLKYIKGALMEGLKAAGVRTEEGVVEIFRFSESKPVFVGLRAAGAFRYNNDDYWLVHQKARKVETNLALPMCKCEYCVVKSLRGKLKERKNKLEAV